MPNQDDLLHCLLLAATVPAEGAQSTPNMDAVPLEQLPKARTSHPHSTTPLHSRAQHEVRHARNKQFSANQPLITTMQISYPKLNVANLKVFILEWTKKIKDDASSSKKVRTSGLTPQAGQEEHSRNGWDLSGTGKSPFATGLPELFLSSTYLRSSAASGDWKEEDMSIYLCNTNAR